MFLLYWAVREDRPIFFCPAHIPCVLPYRRLKAGDMFFVCLRWLATRCMTLRRAWALQMRHTATPQRSKNVPAHTHSFAHRDSVCCMPRSTHALLPFALHELSQLATVPQKMYFPSIKPLPYSLHASFNTAHRAQIWLTHICCESNQID